MKRRTFIARSLITASIAAAFALPLSAGAATALKFSHTDQPGGARHMAAELFAKKVGEYTQGRYEVKVYPAG